MHLIDLITFVRDQIGLALVWSSVWYGCRQVRRRSRVTIEARSADNALVVRLVPRLS